ncbi:hypothetical protein SLEP1_g18563 [Rubroshorea leprosula]|uniref:rRNA methyltransferase 1, mitochondrial n=1 Tax=Rubroshorea leprosula TaxID=152421 RepID=A0AAV5J741_9ROSI|nr:hypothetical protein SLEP1_g18563 [Rubroshorea leprosula]
MRTMCSNLSKGQAFPLVIRFSSQTKCIKQLYTSKSQSLSVGSYPIASPNPVLMRSLTHPHGFGHKNAHKVPHFVRPLKSLAGFCCDSMELGSVAKTRSISCGFRMRSSVQFCQLVRGRGLSSSYAKRAGEKSSLNGTGKRFPWLASSKGNEATAKTSQSSWEESVDRLDKEGNLSSWQEQAKKFEKGTVAKTGSSSRDDLDEALLWRNDTFSPKNGENRNRMVGGVKHQEDGAYARRYRSVEEEEVGGEEEDFVDDPRWYKIKNRFTGMVDAKSGPEKPEFQRWNKQDNWGRKTWKEATESTLPKIVGEGVYGVGPVLAALSAGRREFYALYVQEGLDLSSNNRKKKDKKGFEKVLNMAEKIGLSIKEASKHDLNMVVDNRPHQGLVLDASPLEMVKIKELDPVSNEEEKGSVWVALDEVTDPQNLGAIIRSAYFFGASGVVLCAKNSAPLSGVVSKASAGSLELMELRYCKNMMQFLVSSAENGWRVLGGSVASRAVPLNEILPGAPTILVLGSEGTGLRPLVERSCTQLVRIPGNIPLDIAPRDSEHMKANEVNSGSSVEEFRSFLAVESLNVSVAAGVLLHHLTASSQSSNPEVDVKATDALQ